MRVFNNTDVAIDFRDRVLLPGRSLEYPNVTDQVLTPDERKLFKVGAIGQAAIATIRVPGKGPSSPRVFTVAKLVTIF